LKFKHLIISFPERSLFFIAALIPAAADGVCRIRNDNNFSVNALSASREDDGIVLSVKMKKGQRYHVVASN